MQFEQFIVLGQAGNGITACQTVVAVKVEKLSGAIVKGRFRLQAQPDGGGIEHHLVDDARADAVCYIPAWQCDGKIALRFADARQKVVIRL